LAWLTFVGPSPGGGEGHTPEVLRKERTEIPFWNEDYSEPCSRWSRGFQVSTQVLVETILDRPQNRGALKLYNFTNFDWMPNPNAHDVPLERMRRGTEVVLNHLDEVQPRVIITMETRAHQLLSELLGQQYGLRRPRFAEVRILIDTARQKQRYHRQMDAYELIGGGPLSGKFVFRCPQHPARIYNKDYALRIARALRTVLCCLAGDQEPIFVREG
jgi:hypothetical protein